MKPIIKYQGGKSRELKTIRALAPKQFSRIIEPFCGGAAVTLDYEVPAVWADISAPLKNLYRCVQDPTLYPQLQARVDHLKLETDHDVLERTFYEARTEINAPSGDALHYAYSYIVVRQLCFSGMERYNRSGEFNVPFGHYAKFACQLAPRHHHLLQNIEIRDSWEEALDSTQEGDWIFIDPPYLDRLGYSDGDGGPLHQPLADALHHSTLPTLIVHSEHDFYFDEYEDWTIQTKDFQYAQRWGKDKNHANAKTQHLYITNY